MKRLRYSLRTFLIASIILVVAIGIWARRAMDQRERVRQLQGAHLNLKYDLELRRDDDWFLPLQSSLAASLGKDWVSVPIEAKAKARPVFSDDLKSLSKLRWLRSVDLQGSTADDAGLAYVAALPSLESLDLNYTLVTSEGLTRLSSSQSLKHLNLGSSLVSPESIAAFERRNPRCQVNLKTAMPPDEAETLRLHSLRPDRTPTPQESRALEAWIGVLEARNSLERLVSLSRIEPGITLPPQDSQEYHALKVDVEDDYAIILQEAITALGRLGLAEAIPTLERVARDTSRWWLLRQAALQALSGIADSRIVPIYIDLLEDKEGAVASEAFHRLELVTGAQLSDPGVKWWVHSTRSTETAKEWRQFWNKHKDVIRPIRAPNFGMD
jgi:hypothetical protein